MNGRWLGLCGAVVMTISLASCSAKGQENGVGMLNNTGMSAAGYRTSTSTGRQICRTADTMLTEMVP